jgi:hypothetical protein
MTQLFQRQCRVIVGDMEVRDLRCAFKVKKDSGPKPNTADLVISNLSAATRGRINVKGAPLIIQAGYATNLSTIFSGTVRTVDQIREGANWNTTIRSGDGEHAYQFATVSSSYAPGTPVRAVLSNLLDSLGLDVGIAKTVVAQINGEYVKGFATHGKAVRALDEILGALGYEWSIQDERVQVLKKGEPTREEAVVIGPTTGLVGSPQMGSGEEVKKHAGLVKLKSLLQPRFKPGGKVFVQSDGVNGVFRILNVDHTGDTHGADWFSELEAVPTAAKVVA